MGNLDQLIDEADGVLHEMDQGATPVIDQELFKKIREGFEEKWAEFESYVPNAENPPMNVLLDQFISQKTGFLDQLAFFMHMDEFRIWIPLVLKIVDRYPDMLTKSTVTALEGVVTPEDVVLPFSQLVNSVLKGTSDMIYLNRFTENLDYRKIVDASSIEHILSNPNRDLELDGMLLAQLLNFEITRVNRETNSKVEPLQWLDPELVKLTRSKGGMSLTLAERLFDLVDSADSASVGDDVVGIVRVEAACAARDITEARLRSGSKPKIPDFRLKAPNNFCQPFAPGGSIQGSVPRGRTT